MATAKTRINISVSRNTRDILRALAKRDEMPVASKVGALIEEALELEEDRALEAIIQRRLQARTKQKRRSYSHDEAWNLKKNTR